LSLCPLVTLLLMSTATLLLIAVGLAMDAFAVALGTSVVLAPVSRRQVFRLGFHFGLFQALMPILGWAAGLTIAEAIHHWDHWVAFGLLALVGGRAIYAGLVGSDADSPRADPTRGLSLVVLSLATSIDALAVGLTFAMLRVAIWYPAVIIGLITGVLTTLGMLIGSRLGARFGRGMELLGGIVLVAIGVRILVGHLA
jgi:manganese efflux pump family protein